MAFRKVARADEVPPGKTRFVCVDESPVVLANLEGRICALYGRCPHRNNPLEGATLWGPWLDCPWHHFQYDVRTGENYFPKNVFPKDHPRAQAQLGSLKTYAVRVEDGDIWVDLS
jgi:nitrite reductase/ring-hydroxylating ferredoxin subunit